MVKGFEQNENKFVKRARCFGAKAPQHDARITTFHRLPSGAEGTVWVRAAGFSLLFLTLPHREKDNREFRAFIPKS